MRFPFRLSADLFKAKVSNLLGGASAAPAIFRVTPDEDAITRASQSRSPVIWLGGTEPLLNPEIGRLANDLAGLNRHVFLHTGGYELRRRIHEFRPDPRLFLTLEFAGREETHNRLMERPDAFRRSLEGIRAAKLSGFLVAAHFTVAPESDPCEIGELIEVLDSKDVDGFIASTGGRRSGVLDASLGGKLADVRAMIRCSRWEGFSRLLEASYAGTAPARAAGRVTPSESAYEEGD
jgi:MoaA/NifB/PqqE/SkfB family radical SAM enzyme